MGGAAAFKFVEIKEQKYKVRVVDSLKELNKRLTEINALKLVEGSCVVKPFGHFR